MTFVGFFVVNAALIVGDTVSAEIISRILGLNIAYARLLTTSLIIIALFLLYRRRKSFAVGFFQCAVTAMTLALNSALFAMIMVRNPILQPYSVAFVTASVMLLFAALGYRRAFVKIRNRE